MIDKPSRCAVSWQLLHYTDAVSLPACGILLTIMAKNNQVKKFLSLNHEINRLAWLSKAQKLTISTSAGCGCRRGMSHYDFLPAESTNKFMVSMVEMWKSYFKKIALRELFTCAMPSSHDSEREMEIYVYSPGYISLPSSHCTLQKLWSGLWTAWYPSYHSMVKQKHPAIISSHVSYNNVLQVSYNFSENIALTSEYFKLHRLEACLNINQYTMLLFIWLQIVIRLQRVNNNCIAFFMTYHTLSLYFAHL